MLNFKKGVVSGQFVSGEVDNFIEGTYNYSMEVNPVYLMNETKPSSVSFGVKNVSMNFEIDNPTGYLPVSGTNALISVDLKNSANTIVENFQQSNRQFVFRPLFRGAQGHPVLWPKVYFSELLHQKHRQQSFFHLYL